MIAEIVNLVPQIVAEHEAAQVAARSAVQHAIRCGELLIEAKATMPHGSFGGWCATLPFDERTAQRYMSAAKWASKNPTRVSDFTSLRGVHLAMAAPKSAKPDGTNLVPSGGKKGARLNTQIADLDLSGQAAILSEVKEKPLSPAEAFDVSLLALRVLGHARGLLDAAHRRHLDRLIRGLLQ